MPPPVAQIVLVDAKNWRRYLSSRLLDILLNAEFVQAVLARLLSIEQIEAEYLKCFGLYRLPIKR